MSGELSNGEGIHVHVSEARHIVQQDRNLRTISHLLEMAPQSIPCHLTAVVVRGQSEHGVSARGRSP